MGAQAPAPGTMIQAAPRGPCIFRGPWQLRGAVRYRVHFAAAHRPQPAAHPSIRDRGCRLASQPGPGPTQDACVWWGPSGAGGQTSYQGVVGERVGVVDPPGGAVQVPGLPGARQRRDDLVVVLTAEQLGLTGVQGNAWGANREKGTVTVPDQTSQSCHRRLFAPADRLSLHSLEGGAVPLPRKPCSNGGGDPLLQKPSPAGEAASRNPPLQGGLRGRAQQVRPPADAPGSPGLWDSPGPTPSSLNSCSDGELRVRRSPPSSASPSPAPHSRLHGRERFQRQWL